MTGMKKKERSAAGEKKMEESTPFISFFVYQCSKHVAILNDERIGDESVRTNTNVKYDDDKRGVDIRTSTATQKMLHT